MRQSIFGAALVGHDVDFAAAGNRADVHRHGAEFRVGLPGQAGNDFFLDDFEHASHRVNGVESLSRALRRRQAIPAVSRFRGQSAAFVRRDCAEPGRLPRTSVRSLEKPWLASACAPSLPASSPISARKLQRMRDLSRAELCAQSRTAQSAAAMGPFVSVDPRPNSLPSRMTGSKGEMVMPATLTVSRCGAKARWARGGLACGLSVRTKQRHWADRARPDRGSPQRRARAENRPRTRPSPAHRCGRYRDCHGD